MTRRLQRCRRCGPEWSHRFQRRGYTRHADRVCAACRDELRRGLNLPALAAMFPRAAFAARDLQAAADQLRTLLESGTVHHPAVGGRITGHRPTASYRGRGA